jgi:hypothetical protein
VCGRVDVLTSVAAELDHEKAFARRQFLQSLRVETLDLFVVNEPVVDSLQCDWLVGQHCGHSVCCGHDVRKAKHDKRALW